MSAAAAGETAVAAAGVRQVGVHRYYDVWGVLELGGGVLVR